jgi:hypothetical protein
VNQPAISVFGFHGNSPVMEDSAYHTRIMRRLVEFLPSC